MIHVVAKMRPSSSLGERLAAWLQGFRPVNWIAAVGLLLLVVASFASTGVAGGFLMIGLVVLVTGLYGLVTGRGSWLRIPGRKVAAVAGGAGLVVMIASAANYQPDAQPVAATTATPTATAATAALVEDPVVVPSEVASVVADASVTSGTAVSVLERLPVREAAEAVGYDRVADFGAAWLDMNRNGCSTRDDVLARDLTQIRKTGPCTITAGSLDDPYTGKQIAFTRGSDASQAVQIDHVVSLPDAWKSGAQQLTVSQRITLANDPLNLLAVGGQIAQKKGSADAASWLPPRKEFRCEYVARQLSVKATYGLSVTQAEKDAIAAVLASCPTEPALTSTFAPAPPPVDLAPAPSPEPVAPAPAAPQAPAPAPEPPAPPAPEPPAPPAPEPAPPAPEAYYANCTEARAAGAAPLHVGDPGYRPKLDRDNDGIACE